MDFSNIDQITMKLDLLSDKIVSKNQLIEVIYLVTQDKSLKYLKQLRENNKIKSIFQKYYYILDETERKSGILNYSTNELVFGILNKLKIKWYISFEKGLELNKVLWQSHKKFNIVNNKLSGTFNILGVEYEFKKTKSEYIHNFIKVETKNRITQKIGINEKIFIDYLYFKKEMPLELISNIDKDKFPSLLNSYPINFQKKVNDYLVEVCSK